MLLTSDWDGVVRVLTERPAVGTDPRVRGT